MELRMSVSMLAHALRARLSVLLLGCCDGVSQSVLRSFVLTARCKCRASGMKLPDLNGRHSIIRTSADVPSHIVSMVLCTDRKVLQRSCSLKHIPVVKQSLQCALSLRCPELNKFVPPCFLCFST